MDATQAAKLGGLPAAQRPLGIAVLGAICAAGDPGNAARAILDALSH